MFPCVTSAAAKERKRKKSTIFHFLGEASLPVSVCLMETRAGSAVTHVGPWVSVTTWCPSTGSFTLKNGLIGLATSTTGASRTTGARTQEPNTPFHCFLTNRFPPHTVTVTEELHLPLENEILTFYLHNLTQFAQFCNNLS